MTSLLFLKPLEALINKLLSMDPTSTTQLAELENTFFAWEITDWNLTVYIHIYDKKLIVLNHEEQKPDVHISAELKSYINMLKPNRALVQENKLIIMGDMNKAQKLNHILQNLDIDWEEELSHYIGDRFAHRFSYHLGKIKKHIQSNIQNIGHSLKDNWQHEKKLIPTPDEVMEFCDDVTTLQQDVERLHAKICRLHTHKD